MCKVVRSTFEVASSVLQVAPSTSKLLEVEKSAISPLGGRENICKTFLMVSNYFFTLHYFSTSSSLFPPCPNYCSSEHYRSISSPCNEWNIYNQLLIHSFIHSLTFVTVIHLNYLANELQIDIFKHSLS